jgi:hypothetical protein
MLIKKKYMKLLERERERERVCVCSCVGGRENITNCSFGGGSGGGGGGGGNYVLCLVGEN